MNYLKFQLNQTSVVAVSNVTNWSGTCYVMPLLGAFLADAYFGRYWTIAAFSIVYVFVSLNFVHNIMHYINFILTYDCCFLGDDFVDSISIRTWTKTVM